jgi:hypothetical protein
VANPVSDSARDRPDEIPEIKWSMTSGHAVLSCVANLFFFPREIAKCEPAASNAKGEARITDLVRIKTNKPLIKPINRVR